MLRKLAWHIAAGWRLLQPARMAAAREAVLAPDGKCLHAEPEAQEPDVRAALRNAARAIDRARGPLRRTDPEGALALWRGLVLGRWSLVDRFESDGRRYVIACRNDVGCDDPRGLTARERQCAHLAASGYGNAEIAYALSLKESTAGSHVHRAVRKLGLRRRTDLTTALKPIPQDAHLFSLDPSEGSLMAASVPTSLDTRPFAALTPAERSVAQALVRGSPLKAIGRSRGTSERTVANQVQSIYRKLGVQSCAQLVALLNQGHTGHKPD